ncbi:hypothetical protein [Jiangella asiatica]|uniref:hypothetical protein n=1 Tax=Jiangella asiatica TaxID=2530372 RepID=UPI0013A5D9D6|nr:hypothetical protein [Jiangella asiatica]
MIISPALRIRAVSAALALIAGVGLLAYEPAAQPAGAAESDLTASAVTLSWSDGVTGADNSTVVEERDPDHYLYDDFDGLEVTVSQTEDIRSQGLDVTWSGWDPTPGSSSFYAGNFLQMMQCWGDEETGPLPENCVWGAFGLSVGGLESTVGDRRVHSDDPLRAEAPAHYDDPDLADPSVPFRPVDEELIYYNDLGTVFDRWTTNEVRAARTNDAGGGEAIFAVHDAFDAPHLGCGSPVEGTDGSVDGRDCWLVIVPHGVHQLDGTPVVAGTQPLNWANGAPLTPTLWSQRMQVRLDFAPVDGTCPVGAAQRATVGSELMAEAISSWQPGLCADDGASYSYIPTSDAEGRRQVALDSPVAPGMAFTYAPVVTGETGPPVLHAPVAASGVAIAFNIEQRDGTVVRDLRLTPRLVAKLLTQSYRVDVPGGYEAFDGLPEAERPVWAMDNPSDISRDPEFQELNPDAPAKSLGFPGGNVLWVPGPNPADALRELWRWVLSDDEAVAWLSGEPDEHGMVVNPYIQELGLDESAAPDTVPRDVQTCYRDNETVPEPGYCSLDLLPYATRFADAAAQARAGRSGSKTGWDPTASNPTGGTGWWAETERQQPGQRWQLAVTDTASAERYGLPVASLRNAAGEFVAPTDAGLTAGVEAMVSTEVDGVMQIDPETDDPEAYPLAMVTYAAVREEQDEEALADYSAFLTYAAGPGQTPGLAAGQLPLGYVPLSEELRAQTLAVAEDLVTEGERNEPPRLIPPGAGEDEDPGDEGSTGGGDEGGADDGGDDGGDESGGGPDGTAAEDGLPGGGSEAPNPAAISPGGDEAADDDAALPPADGAAGSGTDDGVPPAVEDAGNPVAQSTPGEPVGPMQYALLVVLIVGLLGATAGPALLKLGPRHA